MSKQDPSIKHNPFLVTFDRHGAQDDYYTVPSASGRGPYEVALNVEDEKWDHCTCLATKVCWHIETARLRRLIDRQTRASECHYALWQLAELADEDERLRAVLAEADSYLVRAQLGVVGTLIGELLDKQVAA